MVQVTMAGFRDGKCALERPLWTLRHGQASMHKASIERLLWGGAVLCAGVLGCWGAGVLGAGCWVLGAGYGMCDLGCVMWDAGCGMWDVGCGMCDVGCWVLGAGCWMLDAGCWVRPVWRVLRTIINSAPIRKTTPR